MAKIVVMNGGVVGTVYPSAADAAKDHGVTSSRMSSLCKKGDKFGFVTRSIYGEARSTKSTEFKYDGEVCCNGHVAYKYTATGVCYMCRVLYSGKNEDQAFLEHEKLKEDFEKRKRIDIKKGLTGGGRFWQKLK